MERINATFSVDGNILDIIPDEIRDSSKYTIKISGLKSVKSGKELPAQIFTVITAVSPAYCALADLKSVTEGFNVSDENMLSYCCE